MNPIAGQLNIHPIFTLFCIIAIGIAIGRINFRGFAFGSSAVIFVAIVFGHFGIVLPNAIRDLGCVLFVYAVGLQAGPRVFRSIKQNGIKFLFISLFSLIVSAGVICTGIMVFNLDPGLGVGIFAGALASTPALAAALDINQNPSISIGYGISYPLGVFLVILFIQWLSSTGKTREELENEKILPSTGSHVQTKQFVVTNPNCVGKILVEIDLSSMTKAIVTRIMRGHNVYVAFDDFILQENDVIMAMGTERELRKLNHIIGHETHIDMECNRDIVIREIFVSSTKIAGKMLRELEVKELHGVILTRLWRDGIEIIPTGDTTLELGDLIRVVGDKDDIDLFAKLVGREEQRIHETNLLPLCFGIVLGILLGMYSFQFPGGLHFNLGLSGGPLLVALIAGHFGRIGHISLRVPYGAKYLSRELGLVLFLAATGTNAGSGFAEVFKTSGLIILFFGLLTTISCILSAYIIANYFFRLSNLSSIGVVCGAMTSTPALSLITTQVDSNTPTIAYASIYAISLVSIIILAQLLAMLF